MPLPSVSPSPVLSHGNRDSDRTACATTRETLRRHAVKQGGFRWIVSRRAETHGAGPQTRFSSTSTRGQLRPRYERVAGRV